MGSTPDPGIPVSQLQFPPAGARDLVVSRSAAEEIRYRYARVPMVADQEIGNVES